MRLITYSPITRTSNLFNQIDRWFDNIAINPSIWKPSFEVLDMDTSYRVRAELPGMDKKDVNIEIQNDVLTISGEKKYNNENLDSNYSEFSYGEFSRSFNLPDDVKGNNIKASMRNGILALEIPRSKKIKPDVKRISIK
tara:strand:+ start:381 stop:797 length:417 start_codon:yes stop_codon:yes gene_type:complete